MLIRVETNRNRARKSGIELQREKGYIKEAPC